MKTTLARAELLAAACGGFEHLLGPCTTAALLELMRLELGHSEILDSFQRRGSQYSKAIAPETILHVVSGNTPHAALQSLVRGLLLGSLNLCKLPSVGIPEVARFVERLQETLRSRVRLSNELPESWLAEAGAMIVFGSDETVAHFRCLARPAQVFLGHGNKLSLGVVFSDTSFTSAPAAAKDASLFDQQGCHSPHGFYVADEPRLYAAALAREMERFEAQNPRGPLSIEEAADINEVRETCRFCAGAGEAVELWESAGSNAWTVIFDAGSRFTPSCLNRVVFVRPLPADLPAALADVRPALGTIGIWPNTREFAERAAGLGASRICGIGSMQSPPWHWHQDGVQTLAPLVRWIDWQP